MNLSDFDYVLPPELIAQTPAPERTASRLLHLDGATGAMRDLQFRSIASLVGGNDVLVLNDTRVIKARLLGRKTSGGRVEVLVERIVAANEVWAQMRVSHPPRPAETVFLGADDIVATIVQRDGGFFRLRFEGCDDVLALLDRYGAVPLPPYIDHAPDDADAGRYQTVYAREPGAVAAPTAGLHFDAALLDSLRAQGARVAYVTLHVGAGTFQPVRVDDLAEHRMHSEWYSVPQATVDAIAAARAAGGRVIAVGTTSLRALESAGKDLAGGLRAGAGETNLFIVPGYAFRVVDRLLTNFHLPKSTLLMLVSAFAGMDNIRAAYRRAVEARYRFFSYGDAMLIEEGTVKARKTAAGERARPEPRERYARFVTITTRIMDNDLYNHVNNATYYSFIDTAVTSYLAHAVERDLARDPVAYLVVENGCNYFSPVAFPDTIHCGLRATHIGTSSMRFEVGIFRNDETRASAQGWFVQVCCDRVTQRPIPMPPRVRAALEAIGVGAL